jgi:hypothetical protein
MQVENIAPHLMQGNKVTKSFPYHFTEEEITELGKKAAHAYERIQRLKAEKKAIVAQHDDNIKQAELTHGSLNGKIVSGIENRDFNCTVTLDFSTGRKYYYSVIDGKEMGSEPLDSDDYQIKVRFDMEQAKDAQDAQEEKWFVSEDPFVIAPEKPQEEPLIKKEKKPAKKSEDKPTEQPALEGKLPEPLEDDDIPM